MGCVLDAGPVDSFSSGYFDFSPSLSLSMLHTRFIRMAPSYKTGIASRQIRLGVKTKTVT